MNATAYPHEQHQPMPSRLKTLHNRHQGETAVLVANGPSLNRMDLRVLRHATVIGMNKIYLGLKRFGFYPRYYVAVNDKVLQQAAEPIKALNCVKFLSHRCADFIAEDALTHHLDTTRPPARFCADITHGLHAGWTVTHAALQIAYFLGFQKVVIIGMDHRFEYSGAPNEARVLDGPDPNHFSPDYFGHGQSWDNPDLERSEESYRIARAEFESDGRRIFDATVDGACTIFEKADFTALFGASRKS
jgi:hypothetical protein